MTAKKPDPCPACNARHAQEKTWTDLPWACAEIEVCPTCGHGYLALPDAAELERRARKRRDDALATRLLTEPAHGGMH